MRMGRIGQKQASLSSYITTAGALVLAAAVLLGVSADVAEAGPGRKTPRLERIPDVRAPLADDMAVLTEVNRIRRSRGLRPFRFSQQLWVAARDHSIEQARYGYMGHGSPVRGRDRLEQRIDLCGYNGRAFGEVVAFGYRSAREVVQGWMDSRGHREILMDRTFTEAAFSRIGTYWTGNTGTPRATRRTNRAIRDVSSQRGSSQRGSTQGSRAGSVPVDPAYRPRRSETRGSESRHSTAPRPRTRARSVPLDMSTGAPISSPGTRASDAGAGSVPTFRRVSTAGWFMRGDRAQVARPSAVSAPRSVPPPRPVRRRSTEISGPSSHSRSDRGAASVDALWPSRPKTFRYEASPRVNPAARPRTPYRSPVRPAVRSPSRNLTPAQVRPVDSTTPRVVRPAPKPVQPVRPSRVAPRAGAVPAEPRATPRQAPRRVRAKRSDDDCFT